MHFLKDRAGFSLIELVVALVILSIIIPLSAFFINSMKTNDLTEEQQTANHVAQKYMEGFKAKSLKELQDAAGSSDFVDSDTKYHVKVTVDIAPVPELETIIGEVEITKEGGKPKITFGGTSYIANNGENVILVIEGEKLKLKKGTDTKISMSLTPASLAPNTLVFSLVVKNDPKLKLKIKNKLSAKTMVLNTTKENPGSNFEMETDEGKILILNTKQAEKYERGANITVIVKDKNNDKELLKIMQSRKI